MLKKIVIAVFVGGLLSPVGLAFSHTGGKGLVSRGYAPCGKKARAAGGSHPSCVTTIHSTVTRYKTVTKPSTTTRTVNHTTTSTRKTTYTSTHTGGNVTVVKTVSNIGTQTYIVNVYPSTETETSTVPSSTETVTKKGVSTVIVDTTTTLTETVTTTVTPAD
jgi:hypothetical protein